MQKTITREQKDRFQLLRNSNHDTFSFLIDKHKRHVFQCCRTFGLREDEAEDVANETFLAAYRGLSQYKHQAEFGTWLRSITYQKVFNHIRKRQKKKLLESRLYNQYFYSKVYEPTIILQSKETEKSIWKAVMRLPKHWALSILLYYREGKSIADISKLMKTKENTIKAYLFRARKRLKHSLASIYHDTIDFS